MEAQLVHQAELVFGEAMTRKLADRAVDTPIDLPTPKPRPPSVRDETQAAAEASPDNVPPLLKLNMTTRQQRKLWRHVESIENFWEMLDELEPGMIARLAALAAARR